MPRTLMIIIASTRPNRIGKPIGDWVETRARTHDGFDIDLVDLKELDLPFVDEPNHPRMREYTQQHTKDWSARVEGADAFPFVHPEYNFGVTAPLKNAIDYLNLEWNYKPLGLASYGGISAGTRAAQMIREICAPLKLFPIPEGLALPMANQFLDEEGEL